MNEWLTYNRYDDQGRLILKALPSAVTSFNVALPDLVDYTDNGGGASDTATGISSSAGLIYRYDYGTTNGATGDSDPAGDAVGFLKDIKLQHGLSGSPMAQSSYQYVAGTISTTASQAAATIYLIGSSTVYRNTDGTGAETTQYGYSWKNLQPAVIVTTLPDTSSQNGTASVSTVYFDGYGRPQWEIDARGSVSYTGYDDATGAAVVSVMDINTSSLPTAPI